jgi:hypothetical protein
MESDLKEVFPLIYRPVGEVVVTWAMVERILTVSIGIIYHDARGSEVCERLPFGLTDKIKFVRLCLRQMQPLQGLQPEFGPLLVEAKRLADVRNYLVHGAVMDWDKETGTVEFVKFDPKDGHYQNSKRRFTMGELAQAADDSIILAGAIGNLTQRLAHAFMREY